MTTPTGPGAEPSGMPAGGAESRRRELLRFLKRTPQDHASLESAARRMGAPVGEVEQLVRELLDEGAIQREGDRLIAVEPATSSAPPEVTSRREAEKIIQFRRWSHARDIARRPRAGST